MPSIQIYVDKFQNTLDSMDHNSMRQKKNSRQATVIYRR